MPKDLIGIITIIVVSFFIIQTGVTYATTDSTQKEIISTLTETVEVSAVESFDYSSRISRGLSYIDTDLFEQKFEQNFQKNNNVNMTNYTLNYEYLKDGEIVKAIRVILLDSENVKYGATVVLDLKNDVNPR